MIVDYNSRESDLWGNFYWLIIDYNWCVTKSFSLEDAKIRWVFPVFSLILHPSHHLRCFAVTAVNFINDIVFIFCLNLWIYKAVYAKIKADIILWDLSIPLVFHLYLQHTINLYSFDLFFLDICALRLLLWSAKKRYFSITFFTKVK